MKFDTKIAVALREDVPTWQKLNMTAFMVSGIAGSDPSTVGEDYADASGNTYLPMFRQPVLVFSATGDSKMNAPWGELMSTACVARGGRGQVTDGAIRDVRFIRALGLPVYAAGYRPVDSRGRGRDRVSV